MTPDYDLSKLRNEQVELWIYLRVDAIFGQIVADQEERLGSSSSAPGRSIVSTVSRRSLVMFSNRLRGVGV
jgi:hypothetical protein